MKYTIIHKSIKLDALLNDAGIRFLRVSQHTILDSLDRVCRSTMYPNTPHADLRPDESGVRVRRGATPA